MKAIDPKTIHNSEAAIADAVMKQVIPLVNELVKAVKELRSITSSCSCKGITAQETQGEAADDSISITSVVDTGAEEIGDSRGLQELKLAFGELTGQVLSESAYSSVGQVLRASDEELLEIKGIGEGRLKKIRAYS